MFQQGDIASGNEAARTSRVFSIVGIAMGIVIYIIAIIVLTITFYYNIKNENPEDNNY